MFVAKWRIGLITYAEPGYSAANGTGNHRCPEGVLVLTQLLGCYLLDSLVNTEVQS